jgi:hypothetical protein
VSPRAALAEALLVTLATPATWPLALGAFLLRGGLVLVVLPIIVLPSPVSLGNLLGPALTRVVLSGVPVELVIVVGVVALAVVAWIAIGGWIAAILEAECARLVAHHDDGAEPPVDDGDRAVSGRLAARIVAARLVAHVPTAVALVWGSARLVNVAYRELTSPSDVVSPIALRVLRGAPDAVVAVGALWILGEIVGGLAARRIALSGSDARGGLRDGTVAAIRRPLLALVGFVVPAAGLALVVLLSAVAASVAWAAVRVAMDSDTGPIGPTFAVMLFVALWLVGLLLISVTTAWRAGVWSIIERDRLTG